MDPSEFDNIVARVREHMISIWTLGEVHGVKHWDRVYGNGKMLVTPGVCPTVVALFAYLHDSCRIDDHYDVQHGERAALWIDSLRDSYLQALSDDEFVLLKEACRLHTTTLKIGNATIDACFDADRLDLWRVGITPEPERLATEMGKCIARATDYGPWLKKWWVTDNPNIGAKS